MTTFSLTRIVVAVAASSFLAVPVGAQQVPAQNPATPPVTADTGTAVEGSRNGRSDADDPSVAGRAVLGFLGGLPIGFLGPLVSQGDPGGSIGIGSGVGIIGAAWIVGSAKPRPSPYHRERGEAYWRAYSESYKERLLERRAKAAVLGGLGGVLFGFGVLFLFLSQYTSS